MEIERVFYSHDGGCTTDNFDPPNERGLKRCKDCGGIFDAENKGVATTDLRFDENYIAPE